MVFSAGTDMRQVWFLQLKGGHGAHLRWTSSSEGRPFRRRLKVRLWRCEGVEDRL